MGHANMADESAQVKKYVRQLKSPSWTVRRDAADKLGELRAEEAVEPLVKALEDSSKLYVRDSAAFALINIGKPTVEAAIGALKKTDFEAKWLAARVLGLIGDQQAVEPLSAYFERIPVNSMGRLDALLVLSNFKNRELVELFLAEFASGRWDDMSMAHYGIQSSLVASGDWRVTEHLISTLEGGEEDRKYEAIRLLRQIGDARATEALVLVLDSDDWDLRECAIDTLEAIGDKRAVLPLEEYRDDDEETIEKARQAAMSIAATKKHKSDWTTMQVLLFEYTPRLPQRYLLRRYVKPRGGRQQEKMKVAIDAFQGLTESGGKWAAAENLVEFGSKAVDPLLRVLEGEPRRYYDPKDVRNNSSFDPTRQEWQTVFIAACTLAEIGDSRAVQPLVEKLSDFDWRLRFVASYALGKLNDKSTLPDIKLLLSDRFEHSRVLDEARRSTRKLRS